MKENKYIPALKFKFLTKYFDLFLRFFMNEYSIKSEFISAAKIKDNDKVLDFGCGTGTLLKILLDLNKSFELYGIDIDKDVLTIARNKLNEKVNLNKYDGLVLPYADHSFDIVLSSLAIHHIQSDHKKVVFAEIKRVLKLNGAFYLLDFGSQKRFYSRMIVKLLRLLEPIDDNINGKLPDYLKQAGFTHILQHSYFTTFFGDLTIYECR